MAPTYDAGCPLCGSHQFRAKLVVHTTDRFETRECASCGLVYAWPRPTTDELSSFYSATYFAGDAGDRLGYSDYRALGELNARRAWSLVRRFAPLDQARPRRILDVGCATGAFLAEAQSERWECVGVEMSPEAAAVAREEFGLRVFDGDIFSAHLDGEQFGLVTMWHVLEHVIDPAATLDRARDLLAPGALLFVELPNWNSLGRIIRGASWSQLKPPEHINFFTEKTLTAAVEQHGFRSLRAGTYYPSMWDKARVRRASQVVHLGGALVASAASAISLGGYLRIVASRA